MSNSILELTIDYRLECHRMAMSIMQATQTGNIQDMFKIADELYARIVTKSVAEYEALECKAKPLPVPQNVCEPRSYGI